MLVFSLKSVSPGMNVAFFLSYTVYVCILPHTSASLLAIENIAQFFLSEGLKQELVSRPCMPNLDLAKQSIKYAFKYEHRWLNIIFFVRPNLGNITTECDSISTHKDALQLCQPTISISASIHVCVLSLFAWLKIKLC